ncbi:glycoside hydrolase family 2 [Chitinophaga alhagiae]|uniref:Glycoside hydrolase family 2 n=1 Tax=Chitinophaga alhagiae TaxID=2203219 RepID=A0ABM6WDM9_9BACT|nr:glycosyl hydrolase [Chitinophaga alhagiae]AWO01980.1 glycoside hydrolase family 2 [Chitinophaga alhagiae]
MKRRDFLLRGTLLTTGYTFLHTLPGIARGAVNRAVNAAKDLYGLFKDPLPVYRPFVRWWWNGDKIEKDELIRELRVLKENGIGGVEINPIKFPARTDDMGKAAVIWLSDQWNDLLLAALKEARSLGMTADLIVGSGWPFGAEYLKDEERSQVVVIAVKKLEGPLEYETSMFDLFREADPAITSPFSGRTMEMIKVMLVPDPLGNLEDVQDVTAQVQHDHLYIHIPKGKYALYGLVKIHGFMEVINGAPGANGPVLNHYNKEAVNKYLNHMTDTIQQRIGPLSSYVRAFFTDSMELEGANWCSDMMEEFKKRRGYNLFPYLPFVLLKISSMGNTYDYTYGVALNPELKDMAERMRYDFELTKAELLEERFIQPFADWCRKNNVKSRVQAYGRGYFLLEGSFAFDLPECETWLKYGIGTKMPEDDPRMGRAYTMINKYVSSAAHLKGKKYISAEELTNTDMVFNDSLEILKIAGDQSTISGVTHPIFHGFNYSPPDAPFPGWIRYGGFYNERNPWWPYFRHFTDYKARLSALLQQGEMFADIAVLPPTADMWSIYSAQNEPFPHIIHPPYQTLVWEAIHKNGSGCDYVSERVIQDAVMKNGHMHYGPRKYHTIFMIEVRSMAPATLQKLHDFIQAGGRVFCIEACPEKATGWQDHAQRDAQVQALVAKMKTYADRFILLKKPEKDFIKWYRDVQEQYHITPYVNIQAPHPFITQVRYQANDAEILFFTNSHMDEAYTIDIHISEAISRNKQAWLWNPDNGERHHIPSYAGFIRLDLGPADSRLLVFDKTRKGPALKPLQLNGGGEPLTGPWKVEFRHLTGAVNEIEMAALKDLAEMEPFRHFTGTILYRHTLQVTDKQGMAWLDLGKAHGISEVFVNGQSCGVQWYGRRLYYVGGHLKTGANALEVKITTNMGNYMKTLKDNRVAQYWTNEARKNQPIQSMGLIGPVKVAPEEGNTPYVRI